MHGLLFIQNVYFNQNKSFFFTATAMDLFLKVGTFVSMRLHIICHAHVMQQRRKQDLREPDAK